MPRLSSWYLRASLLYLGVGFTLGALLLANKGLGFYPPTWSLLPVHMEFLLMGWFVQLAIGMAFWILPRISGPQPRGNERLAWFAFWLINAGIFLIILQAITSTAWLLFAGRALELGGVVIFVAGSWKRVKPFGT